MATGSSYWCYRCSRFVRVWPQDSILCPDCDGGFLEEIGTSPEYSRRNILAGDNPQPIRTRRNRPENRPLFNPVVVLRIPSEDHLQNSNFEFYYDDGESSGLRPLPPSMSGFLMGSGLERLLDQLAQIEINGLRALPPASKEAIQSMPTVEITSSQDCNCAVCIEPFDVGAEVKEMPCKHIFHKDCILPWLSVRNSCPVCRHEMPADARERGGDGDGRMGLTIWRLPGGGFAVGRFGGGERRLIPAVYTEMDGGFNAGGGARRISWDSRGNGSRQRGGIGRIFRSFFSSLGRRRSASSGYSS